MLSGLIHYLVKTKLANKTTIIQERFFLIVCISQKTLLLYKALNYTNNKILVY